ncbi:MAG: hypothetical protein QM813_17045 [Verrucomicrobiota bacterium]
MSYKVAIRDNDTDEIRLYEMEGCDWEDGSLFFWTDGNFGCDCNRRDLFLRAAGIEPDDESPCGNVAYSALYAELPDGSKVPIDMEGTIQ